MNKFHLLQLLRFLLNLHTNYFITVWNKIEGTDNFQIFLDFISWWHYYKLDKFKGLLSKNYVPSYTGIFKDFFEKSLIALLALPANFKTTKLDGATGMSYLR